MVLSMKEGRKKISAGEAEIKKVVTKIVDSENHKKSVKIPARVCSRIKSTKKSASSIVRARMESEEEEGGRHGGAADADEEVVGSENKKESSSKGEIDDVDEDGGERKNERGEQGEVAVEKPSPGKRSPAKDAREPDLEPVVPASAGKKKVGESTAATSGTSQREIGEDAAEKLLANPDFMRRLVQKYNETLPEVRSPSPSGGVRHDLVLQTGRAVAEDLKQKKGLSGRGEVRALRDYNKGPLSEGLGSASLFSHRRQSEKKRPGSGAAAKKRSPSAAGFVIKEERKKPRAAHWLEYFPDVTKGFLQSSLVTPDELETAGNFGPIDDGLEASLVLFKGSARGKRNDVNLDFYQTMFWSVKESDMVKHMKVFVACDSHFSAMVQGDQSVLTSQWETMRWNQINTNENLFSLVKDMKSMFLPDEVIIKKKVRHPLKSHADYNSAAFLVSFQVWLIGVRFVQMSFLLLTSVVSVIA
jgi:acyl-CoA hydrolase